MTRPQEPEYVLPLDVCDKLVKMYALDRPDHWSGHVRICDTGDAGTCRVVWVQGCSASQFAARLRRLVSTILMLKTLYLHHHSDSALLDPVKPTDVLTN